MISRYCKNRIPTDEIQIKTFMVLDFVTDEDGKMYKVEIPDKVDMSVYGDFGDWSLDTMVKSGINPASFSSPSVTQSRLEASQKIGDIDLSAIDTPTE